jgi:ribosome-associated protein
MSNDEDGGFEQKSKSRLKRESTALQDLGEELVSLTASQLRKFDLPENLHDAIVAARDMSQRGARKRQLQYIGKLMREVDAEPIFQALEVVKNPGRTAASQFHKLERWRDRLLAEGDAALQELLIGYPDIDRQHLRQLIRKAEVEKSAEQTPRAARVLFEYLRDLIGTT